MKRIVCLLFLSLLIVSSSHANSESDTWNAQWIGPSDSITEYGVYYFRKTFSIDHVPEKYVVHVSGDNQYQLFINGTEICNGPAKSDVAHWKYETVDIAPFLSNGENCISAKVWNDGKYRQLAQMSLRTGFILQGDSKYEQELNTNSSWKMLKSFAYSPINISSDMVKGYYASVPGENINGNRIPWGWKSINFNDSSWNEAFEIGRADLKFNHWTGDWTPRWMLVPREIPMMETRMQRIEKVLETVGLEVPEYFLQKPVDLLVPAHTKIRLLLDQSYITTAFPVLKVTGGAQSKLTICYAESLFEKNSNIKGNRNEFENKEMYGITDEFILDGGPGRTYMTNNWRAFRYLEVTIQTSGEELIVNDIYGIYSAYPFQQKANFESSDTSLSELLEIGWRTARVCAHDTYMDTPFYEQLQYVGDTRIQGMISIFNSGDARLLKQAIHQINNSRLPEGITYSRYPSSAIQLIPPFSLWWIGMLHDYMMYVPDSVFVKEMISGVRSVLSFFSAFQNENGSLQNLPWWNFMDWAPEWEWGIPPIGSDGSSALFDLLLLNAYQWAIDIETESGNPGMANKYQQKATQLNKTVKDKYWNSSKKLFSDTSDGKLYSQQTNTLAILANVIEKEQAAQLLQRILKDKNLVQCTSYFQYYMNGVLAKNGMGNQYLNQLGEWYDQKDLGLTTWRESPEPSRSDCHAWSASPNVELYRTILGIRSLAPGFSKVLIEPNPSKLEYVSGQIPHPLGSIKVEIDQRSPGSTSIKINMPQNITGVLIWKDKSFELNNKKEYNFTL